ncbi:MAG: ABC transporter ATP-binding protein/permease [Alphaproteobacteria bacterium]|nr:ABC transporter ATP-binding protein/permease [Alphaproteobacteria bacterium]
MRGGGRAPFDPNAPTEARNQLRTLRTLLPYLWQPGEPGLKARVVIALSALVGAKALTLYAPVFYGRIVDSLSGPAQIVAVPVAIILAYSIARALASILNEIRDGLFARVAQHAIRQVALQTFRHLHGLSMRFHLERRMGGLSRVIERGTKGIQFLLNFTLFNILPTLIEVVGVAVILHVVFGIAFSSITLLSVLGYIVFTVWVTEWRTKYRRAMNTADAEANTKAVDSLLNYETVKYFGNERHEAGRFDDSLARYQHAAVRSQVTLSMLNIGQQVVVNIALFVLLLLAARGVVGGTMTLGELVMINTYLIQLYIPLNFLGFVYREIKQSLVDMEVMFDLLVVQQEVADKPDAKPLAVSRGTIEFDHVTFGYSPDRVILRDVSFTVPAGKTVAIVGPSGAGKSTISRILFRFYDVGFGAVRIDGQDIREVTQQSLRHAIGVVPQDTVLFDDSVGYNMRYGKPDSTQAEIEAAAKLASIHDFVASLKDGYNTRVGERGLKLSGGEKQRVAIARTMLKDPPILLFDEATSALDSHTEKDIQASLRKVSANRTTLVIAHRLSTVVDADEIIVLDKGQIVERGTHRELIARHGRYAAMWNKQQEAALYQARLAEAGADAAE